MFQEEKRSYAEQDLRITEYITRCSTLIRNVRQNENILALLAAHGYDDARFKVGEDLRSAAQAGFEKRAGAIAAQSKATSELNELELTARTIIADFRMIARAIFTDDSSRSALSMGDYLPDDRQTFITRARGACNAAAGEAYLPELGEFGYDAAFIEKIANSIEELEAADAVQNAAIQAAIAATTERNEAYEKLYAWMKQFRTIARVTLRHDPDLLKILEV